jgi:hypothetical protein
MNTNLLLFALLMAYVIESKGYSNFRRAWFSSNREKMTQGIQKYRKILTFPKVDKEDSWESGEVPWDFVDKKNTTNTATKNTVYTASGDFYPLLCLSLM